MKPADLDILNALTDDPATYVVKNRLLGRGFKVDTPSVLRRLKRLERAGYVQRAPSSYLVMLCWRPTPTGAARP